jgi:hypothetical protein
MPLGTHKSLEPLMVRVESELKLHHFDVTLNALFLKSLSTLHEKNIIAPAFFHASPLIVSSLISTEGQASPRRRDSRTSRTARQRFVERACIRHRSLGGGPFHRSLMEIAQGVPELIAHAGALAVAYLRYVGLR